MLTVGVVAALLLMTAEGASAFSFTTTDFKLKGDAGSRVKVQVLDAGRTKRITVGVRNGRSRADYSAEVGKAGPTRYAAKLKPLGNLRLHFDASGDKDAKTGFIPACGTSEDAMITKQKGVLKGTLNMPGEKGYLGISKKRVKAVVKTYDCPKDTNRVRPREGVSRGGAPIKFLTCGPKGSVINEFHVTVPSRGAQRPQYFVEMFDRLGGSLEVYKSVRYRGAPQGFDYTDDLKSLVIKPGGPFSGKATFTGKQGDSDFRSGPVEGDLAVDFLGTSDVELAPSRADLARTNSDGFCT